MAASTAEGHVPPVAAVRVAPRRGPQRGFVLWALLYAVLGVAGRAMATESGGLGVVWPTAGVAFLWLLAQPTTVRRRACLLVVAVEEGALLLALGVPVATAAVVVVATVVQTVVAVTLLGRWCGSLLGVGGDASVHDLGVLVRGSVAVVLATLLGAAIAGAGSSVLDADVPGLDLLGWWGANLTGIFLVGAVGHLAWEAGTQRAQGRTTWRRAVLGDRGPGELTLLVLASVALYLAAFSQQTLPLAFAVMPLAIWCGARFPTLTAVAHAAVFGTLVVALTVAGRGPFGGLGSAATQARMTEAFLMVLLLTVLAVAAGRDERSALIDQLRLAQLSLAERAELLDAMTEAMTEGVVVTDVSGRIVRTNPAARELLGSDPEGVLDPATAYAVRRPDGSPLDRDDLPSRRALREGAVAPHDLEVEGAAGSPRVVSVSAAALTGGRSAQPPTGAVVVYRDVTEDRQRTHRIADFAAVVAHDLRTPLSVTHGWIQVAASAGADDTELRSKALAKATGACQLMQSMVTDLLAQAVAEDREVDARPLDLGGPDGLVAGLVADLLPPDQQDQVVVEGVVPPVLADRDLVRQLLLNLVTNARKYVAPGTVPRVVVTGHRRGDRVVLDVADNGIGIPDDQRERVFERFYRVPGGAAESTGGGGSGLGLAICRTIVDRHGGRLWCEPAPSYDGSTGTVFHLDLPAAGP